MLKTLSNYNILLYTYFWLSVGLSVVLLSLDYIYGIYTTGIYLFMAISMLILSLFLIIGIVGLFGLIRPYFDKTYKNPKSKHRVLVPIAVFLWFGIANIILIGPADTPIRFDAELWHNSSIHRAETQRERMIEDLIQNYLPGKRQVDIVSLLGEPVDSYEFPIEQNELVYVLKVDKEFMDETTTWLIIRFNETGFYKNHEVLTWYT